jgi:hypothetical protein
VDVQIRIRTDQSRKRAGGRSAGSITESAVFKPELKPRSVHAGTAFAYLNHFQTLYCDVGHFRM